MNKKQQKEFWKNHPVGVFIKEGKIKRVYGRRFPKTAQQIINEVK